MGSHKKHKKEKRKEKKKSAKNKKHKKSKEKYLNIEKQSKKDSTVTEEKTETGESSYEVPLPPGFNAAKPVRLPMTKEQYEAKSKQIRRVLDPVTGRERLVRGDGEIIEEVVSRERHKKINEQATKGDGESFQKTLQNYLK